MKETMKFKQRDTEAVASLRRSAEKQLILQDMSPLAKVAPLRMLHELEVHKIELEMQNEMLQEARNEAETELQRYTDLYDFAPVGYLTLKPDGTILQANLTVARLLGIDRSDLLKRRFAHLIAARDIVPFNALLTRAFESKAIEIGEVSLSFEGKQPLTLELRAYVPEQLQECRIALTDISERKQVKALTANIGELEIFNSTIVDRELRMIALKKEIDALCAQFGLPPRYKT
jgi:PAS domain S-box-containing protein